MNWQAISFDWNQVRAFLAIAEEGSFSAAARVLNTTQPIIGRQISALEASLSITLVERSVKGQTLTLAGQELLDHVRLMVEAATLISMTADRQSQIVAGAPRLLRIPFSRYAIRPYERFAAVTYEVSRGFLEGLESLKEETNGKDNLRRFGCPCGHNRGCPGR